MYVILFWTQLKDNVLNEEDTGPPFFYKTKSVHLGYSFWFLITAQGLLFTNILFAKLAKTAQDPEFLWRRRKSHELDQVENKAVVADGMMY